MDTEKIKTFIDKIGMKNISNFSAIAAVLIVLGSFLLNSFDLTNISIDDAIKVGLFVKGVFLTVDGSVWLEKLTNKNS